MIGRAAIGNPWIFNEIKNYIKGNKEITPPSLSNRIETVKKHLDFSIQWKGEKLGLVEMRRHYTNYFRGMEDFKKYRMKLIHSLSIENSLSILEKISKKYNEKNELIEA